MEKKALGIGLGVSLLGYLFSVSLSGYGASSALYSYINAVMYSIVYLAGIISFWACLFLYKDK